MAAILRASWTANLGVRLSSAAAVLFGMLLFTWPALLNHFPLFYADSIPYLIYAPVIAHALPAPSAVAPFEARGEFYSLGLFLIDHGRTPWATVFFQALLTSYVLWLVVRWVVPRHRIASFLLVALVLSGMSGLSWVVCWILADVLGGLAYLALSLLALAWPSLSRFERALLAAIAWWGLCAHSSHLLLSGFVWVLLGLLLLFARSPMPRRFIGLWAAAAVILVAAASVTGIHGWLYGKPSLDGYHPPYLTARVLADGPGRWYLEQHCPRLQWVLCRHLADLPLTSQDILFGTHGIWLSASANDKLLLRRQEMPLVLASIRAYPRQQIQATLRNFWDQMGMFRFDEFGNDPWIERGIAEEIPQSIAEYRASRQGLNRMPAERARKAQLDLLYASGLILLLTLHLAWKARSRRSLEFLAILIPVVLANALMCGGLSQVDERLQLRIVWFFPLAAMLVALESLPPLLREAFSRKLTTQN